MRDDGELAIAFINLRVYSDPHPREQFPQVDDAQIIKSYVILEYVLIYY